MGEPGEKLTPVVLSCTARNEELRRTLVVLREHARIKAEYAQKTAGDGADEKFYADGKQHAFEETREHIDVVIKANEPAGTHEGREERMKDPG